MSIISKYILKSSFPTFLFGSSLVMSLFLLQFLINNIDKLVGKGLDVFVIIQLIATNLAWMLTLAIPMGVLFSSLMTFGNLSLTFETTVVKASGGSLIKMMAPLAVAGFFISLFLLWFNDSILPNANHSAKILLNDIKRKKPTLIVEEGVFSSQIEGYTILARGMDTATNVLHNTTIYNNKNSSRYQIINADSGTMKFTPDYSKLVLTLLSGELLQSPRNSANNTRIVKFEKALFNIEASGFTFTRSNDELFSRGQRELNIAELKSLAQNSENESKLAIEGIKTKISKKFDEHLNYRQTEFTDRGMAEIISDPMKPSIKQNFQRPIISQPIIESELSKEIAALDRVTNKAATIVTQIESDIKRSDDSIERANEYWVEVHKKFSIPFACFLFVFVGCPLGVITKGGNFGLSAGISLGFYIFYWACLIGGEKLGDRGYLSPFLAMWLGNFIIAILGIILTLRINNETFSLKNTMMKIFKSGKYRLN